MTASTPACPRNPTGQHDRYSDGTCAYCRDAAPTLTDPSAFQQGEAMAYRRVLALLPETQEYLATKGRDQGRGVAHAMAEIRQAVLDLAEDAGLSAEVNPQHP